MLDFLDLLNFENLLYFGWGHLDDLLCSSAFFFAARLLVHDAGDLLFLHFLLVFSLFFFRLLRRIRFILLSAGLVEVSLSQNLSNRILRLLVNFSLTVCLNLALIALKFKQNCSSFFS